MNTFSSFSVLLVLILKIFEAADGHKMVIFVPNVANSQVLFNTRVAETLKNGGNDVTMLFISHFPDFVTDVQIPEGVKTYNAEAFVEGASKWSFEKEQSAVIYKDTSIFDSQVYSIIQRTRNLFADGCKLLLQNKEFLDWLEKEKFDVAYSYMYSNCPIGLIHQAKIPNWIWLDSGMLINSIAQTVGISINPSYIPQMLEPTDEMSFIERFKNFMGHHLTGLFAKYVLPEETEVFREELNDPYFPNLEDLAETCSLIIANSNDLFDTPRPIPAKVINIGGLGTDLEAAKPLDENLQKIVSTGKGTIIFSLGTVVLPQEMPQDWKHSLLDAFAEFPDYQFVMRYAKEDLNELLARLPRNVHLFKWLPQKDILHHNNTKAFITHGGYNSIQEAVTAGVPLITIPLFGEQIKNSKLAKKHGIAVNIAKSELSKQVLVDAIEEVLTDNRYYKNVVRISSMVRSQPLKPAEKLLKWSNYVTEFGPLPNLELAEDQHKFLNTISISIGVLVILIVTTVWRRSKRR